MIKKPLYIPAVLGFGLVILAILVAMSGPIGSRIGWWDYTVATILMQWSAYGGIFAGLLCLAGLIVARPGGHRRGFIFSLLGLGIIIPTLLFLNSWKVAKLTLPPIQDISTNIKSPPEFWNAPNSRTYKYGSIQQEFYPDIKPLTLAISADKAFDLSIQVIRAKKWKLWEPNKKEKHIEATEKTYWFGFSDDVVIHITKIDENNSKVDMRSASRFGGGGDGGTNANRIRSFFKALKSLAAQSTTK